VLDLKEITVSYDIATALWDVSLSVVEGKIVSIVGSNGAGKSTILRTVSGVIHPKAGTISLDERRIDSLPPHQIARLGISHVPEGRRIFPHLSIMENLTMGSLPVKDPKRSDELLRNVFELFPILKERQNQMAQTLSGGEQQMLAIGRALMMQPKILILDEPTLGLAPVILEQLSKALEKLRQTTPITVLLGEQNVTFALPHADRVYVLEHARIVWEGDPGRFAEEAGTGYL